MIATKDNKVYQVSEQDKLSYLNAGYDICEDDGTVLEYGKGRVVTLDEYFKLKNELDELKAEIADKQEASGSKAEIADKQEASGSKAKPDKQGK